jgi:colanic acid biosynthesis glycosyl transferase WcaI
VRFLGLQPTERLQDWLGLADIHLLPQRADVADLVMPSKLTGMLASGRAVLATALPGTGVAEAVQYSGIATVPGDTDAFVAALRQLVNDHALRRRLGIAAREQAEATLARDGILLRFEQRVAHLLGDAFHPVAPARAAQPHPQDPA